MRACLFYEDATNCKHYSRAKPITTKLETNTILNYLRRRLEKARRMKDERVSEELLINIIHFEEMEKRCKNYTQ